MRKIPGGQPGKSRFSKLRTSTGIRNLAGGPTPLKTTNHLESQQEKIESGTSVPRRVTVRYVVVVSAPVPDRRPLQLGKKSGHLATSIDLRLIALPPFDRLEAEPPVAANPEARQFTLPEHPIDCRPMNLKIFGQFRDGQIFANYRTCHFRHSRTIWTLLLSCL